MTQASKTSVPSRGRRRMPALCPGTRPLGFGTLILGALMFGLVAGCEPAPEPVEPPPPPPTPEERFERIVGALEDKLNDSAFGTADAVAEYDAPAGTPITAAKVKVKHTITPPDGEDDVPRAQLCLITKAKVTVTLPTKSEKEESDEESSSRRQKRADDEPLGEGMPPMESLIVPSREEAASRLGSSGVHEIDPGETQRCFNLEYRDDRWVLVSEVDEENEPFNALAIEYALKKQ
ncbi:hypothetical protein K2D_45840 [Planctomycetes bacterium K2D]|uniref:Uncharacterized protein n=2 Tax=Botrimarina mediterranea TaxID=2528022 RepID=A0A518KEY3_9BACT|nr:hypothetical protein Spa11_45810 [Botrimarina mediterranea]QDV80949.1 hypothetical protein K2D_45840 [Planctomycetes bacterium K2D]